MVGFLVQKGGPRSSKSKARGAPNPSPEGRQKKGTKKEVILGHLPLVEGQKPGPKKSPKSLQKATKIDSPDILKSTPRSRPGAPRGSLRSSLRDPPGPPEGTQKVKILYGFYTESISAHTAKRSGRDWACEVTGKN